MNFLKMTIFILLSMSSSAFASGRFFPPYTVTFHLQNNSSHTISGFFSYAQGGDGKCEYSTNELTCTTDNHGSIRTFGSFYYDNDAGQNQIEPLSIFSTPSDPGGSKIWFGSIAPPPAVKATLVDSNWNGKSNFNTTITFEDR